MGSSEPVETLDCRGQRCPLPVIAAARRMPELPVGSVLRVLADDPAAALDFPAWCRLRGQEFLAATTVGDSPAYDIRRLQ
ncbi:sulfurtransferase TusA family protein [Micromonospora sp. NPDC050397]|uniref:sulfurtransferase TusA family protein n=1 Tax=Micromonospora sp. NPDC050397 TaxID=3364279 RepID=UPI0038504950